MSSRKRMDDKEAWWWKEKVQNREMRKMLARKKWDYERIQDYRQKYKELKHKVKLAKTMQKGYDDQFETLDTKEDEKDLYQLGRQRG